MTGDPRPLTFPLLRVPSTDADAITLRQEEDGSVTLVGEWPETAVFGVEVFAEADPRLLWRERGRIHLRVANGEADYLITGDDLLTLLVTATRLYARKDDS